MIATTVLLLSFQTAAQPPSLDHLRACSTATHAAMAVSMMVNDRPRSDFWNGVGGEIDLAIVQMTPAAQGDPLMTAQILTRGVDDGYRRARDTVALPSGQLGRAVHAIFTEARRCAAELTPDLAVSEPADP